LLLLLLLFSASPTFSPSMSVIRVSIDLGTPIYHVLWVTFSHSERLHALGFFPFLHRRLQIACIIETREHIVNAWLHRFASVQQRSVEVALLFVRVLGPPPA